MAERVVMYDYEDELGHVDWSTYRAAQRENGERCMVCGVYIGIASGHPIECGSCKRIHEQGGEEVSHHIYLRCPKCRCIYEAAPDGDHNELLGDGEHTVFCPECDHTYTITTHVSWLFTSPPLLGRQELGDG